MNLLVTVVSGTGFFIVGSLIVTAICGPLARGRIAAAEKLREVDAVARERGWVLREARFRPGVIFGRLTIVWQQGHKEHRSSSLVVEKSPW